MRLSEIVERSRKTKKKREKKINKSKAGYTATPVACGWAGAVIEIIRSFGQMQRGKKNKKS